MGFFGFGKKNKEKEQEKMKTGLEKTRTGFWGNILNAAQDLYVMQNYWWLWLPVGIVVSLFVISVNCIGDGLRDSTDPTQQG